MKNFVVLGLAWTAFMFFTLNIVFPYVEGFEITVTLIVKNAPLWLVGLPVWLLCGMIYTNIAKNKYHKNDEKLG
jgi:hypothetical protein